MATFTRQDYPALSLAAAATSRAGQRTYLRLARFDLILMVAGATLGALTPLLPGATSVVTVPSALLLLLAVLIRLAGRSRGYDRAWFDRRAVAESVKTATWRFVIHADPYSGDDQEAEHRFVEALGEILAARRGLQLTSSAVAADTRQITSAMRQTRALPLAERRAVYLQDRLLEESNWYASRSAENQREAERWFWLGTIGQVAALMLAVLRIANPDILNLVGVLAALVASISTWTQLRRHDELARSYGLAAQELLTQRALLESAGDEAQLAHAAKESEDAISREHTLWVAKRT